MTVRILRGDCLDVLRTLPADSVHCCVTSPPYYGLRDYGTAQWDGGDPACGHVAGMARQDTDRETPGGRGGSFRGGEMQYRDACGKCGARRIDRQIGLEPTPDAYIATMVEVFREVRRVLRPDGTLWLNLGDSYASGEVGRHDHKQAAGICVGDSAAGRVAIGIGMGAREQRALSTGLPPKNLLMMPARVALALQADGWWLRSDIIWHKPNPMPESVNDRPTSAHEHVFLLAKSPRYFWDAEAVREEAEYGGRDWTNGRKTWDTLGQDHSTITGTSKGADPSAGRNIRNVWTIATAPFSEAHFATFPPELAERCIKAGTSERGACSVCGAPWVRQVERAFVPQPDVSEAKGMRLVSQHDPSNQWPGTPRGSTAATTTGWSPSCACSAGNPVPCVVLDCFGGAGTVGLVADRLQRDAVLIELNPDYAKMAERRLHSDAGLFAMVASA